MTVTVEEAKTKHCPMARYGGLEDEPSYNRWQGEGHFIKCLGPECMMWGCVSMRDSAGFCGLAVRGIDD